MSVAQRILETKSHVLILGEILFGYAHNVQSFYLFHKIKYIDW